jgi:hypothetical protein
MSVRFRGRTAVDETDRGLIRLIQSIDPVECGKCPIVNIVCLELQGPRQFCPQSVFLFYNSINNFCTY